MAPTPQPYRASDGTVTWQVRYRITGRPNPVKDTFGTQQEAKKFCALIDRVGGEAARATRRQSEESARTVPSLATWFERHLSLLEADATPGTIKDYRGMAARTWLPRLGPLPLDAISREAVTEWVAWQRRQPARRGGTYSPKSIRNAHGLLSSVLGAAVDAELLSRNVAKGVGLPDDHAEHEMEVFTVEEWEAFITAMPEHYRLLTRFLLTTGCRIGEATAIQQGDLDAARNTVRIRRAWKKGETGVYLGSTKSKRGVRTLVLPAGFATELLAATKGTTSDALVFTGPQGARIQAQHYRNRQWAKALVDAGITKRITPHGLRHTSASWLLAAGVSPIVVQHRLGHESLATTSKVYAHLLTDAQAGAVDVMERAMGGHPRVGR